MNNLIKFTLKVDEFIRDRIDTIAPLLAVLGIALVLIFI